MKDMNDGHTHPEMEMEAQEKLRKGFQNIPDEIPIILFTDPDKNTIFNRAAREVTRFLGEMTSKISFQEFNLDHKESLQRGIKYAPTIIFDPEKYRIKWYGAPLGEEGRTFVEALLMMGYGRTNISEQSLRILKRIDSPRNVKVFVSGSCPYCPQQAVNAIKAAIEKPDFISLEIIDIQANPELAQKYSAQSVPQTYLDDKLIAKGAQTEELFMLSLEKMEQQTIFIPESDAKKVEADLVIVGGGPAGLTAGIYATRSGLTTVIIEKGALGGQIVNTPIVENYPGLTQVGGRTLVDLMVNHAMEYVRIFQEEKVMDIKPGDPIVVTTSRRRFTARAVLLATGAKHRTLGARGENRLAGNGVSYCTTCDGPLFKGKKVIIVGGGNSAVTEALHLKNIGVDVTLIHRKDRLRAQERLVESLKDNNVPVIYNTEVKEISGKGSVESVVLLNNMTGKEEALQIDGIFISIGYDPAIDLAKNIGAAITGEGYIKHDTKHRTSIPGIYSAGDVEGGYKQIVTAAGQGSEAALSIFEDLMNPYWTKEN
ncbi:MAG: FAD-dependent oxidoreductase [Deltaproteobacteria bacterium]|nr:FAD-dependent oxidoreductase [Deltaproteobacteria bacterium]